MVRSEPAAAVSRRPHGLRIERSDLAVLAVCLLLFVDVSLPIFGNSARLLALLIIPLFLLGRSGVSTPFCAVMFVLTPMYILVPIVLSADINTSDVAKLLILQFVSVAGMVLMARALANGPQRQKLTDSLILFAVTSAAIAILQRMDIVGPIGRDRWGFSTTAAGELRGSGFLSDPNFFAILLASTVPLLVNWRFVRLRVPALAVLAVGLYATNSRAGIFLATAALAVSLLTRPSTQTDGEATRGRKSVVFAAIVLMALFALNVGGQRDRALQAILIELGIDSDLRTENAVDAFVARERRQLLDSWLDLAVDRFPGGIGMFDQTEIAKAAHNTYVTLFGQGGLIGLAIAGTMLACLVVFILRRSDPYSVMGAVIILGGITLSYPGMVFLVLPMGLADGILAGGLGARPRAGRDRAEATAH